MINGLLLFLIIVNAYLILVFLAARSGLLARYNVGLMGPILMFRTEHGKGVIEWLGKAKRFHTHVGTVGIWVTLFFMGALMLLLIVQIPFVFRIPVEQAPQARHILALPGINPLIPIGYGIVALVAAIIIHEFAHGVLARAQNLKVKTLGVLYLVVPIGAFVEPDEEELTKATRTQRMRVYAAGPMSNLVTALILGIIFSAGFVAALEPIDDGLPVHGVVAESPADLAGIEEGALITSIEGTRVTNQTTFRESLANTYPGQRVNVETATRGDLQACLASTEDGLQISELGPGVDWCTRYPAETPGGNATDNGDGEEPIQASLHGQDILGAVGLNTTFTLDAQAAESSDLSWSFDATGNGTIDATGDQDDLPFTYVHTYEQSGAFTATFLVESETESVTRTITVNTGGFLGVQMYPFGTGETKQLLQHPFSSLRSAAVYIALPFTGLTPMTSPLTDSFEVPWGDHPIAVSAYWIGLNLTYWVMWISLMLGLTNALPAVPLDGGWLFRDFLDGLLNKLKRSSTPEGRAPYVKRTSIVVSLLVLGLILFQFLGPRIAPLFG